MSKELRIVVEVAPGPMSQFVEVEDEHGKSVNVGEWRDRPDMLSELVIKLPANNHDDVKACYAKHGLETPVSPTFLSRGGISLRTKLMREELQEFVDATERGDMHEAADALVDMVYVALGTAAMMGLPWQQLWDEVQRANLAKERVTDAGQSKRGSTLDLFKPPGWQGPDHSAALGTGPWPMAPCEHSWAKSLDNWLVDVCEHCKEERA